MGDVSGEVGKLTEEWREKNGNYMWEETKLSEITVKITDGDHNPPKRVTTGIPYLTARNIKHSNIVLTGCSFISLADYKKVSKRYTPFEGDVLVTCVGTLGETAVVGTNTNFAIDRNIAVLRPNKKILSRFLEYFLNDPEVQQALKTSSGSTAQPHIYLSDLRNTKLSIPTFNEQGEIVKIASRYFQIADHVETQIEKAEVRVSKLTQAILAKTFRQE